MMELKNTIDCAAAKQKDMVSYLASLGYQPVKIRNNNYWYLSPLRNENTPSFKINRNLNRWFDFGLGKGGNLIDFAVRYHNCTVKEFLNILNGFVSSLQPALKRIAQIPEQPKLSIIREHILSSPALLFYLKERRIDIVIADKYCKEICYTIGDKKYYAIGFKNNAGGYELRNKYFKGSSHPKDVTAIMNNAQELSVFEGFFDFLSYQTIVEKTQQPLTDFLILNSLSFFEKSITAMQKYRKVHLFLDNDEASRTCLNGRTILLTNGNINNTCLTKYSCTDFSLKCQFIDESGLYRNYKDLNDMLTGKRLNNRR